MIEKNIPSPTGAWARSLPGVLIGPFFGWLALFLFGSGLEPSAGLDAVLYYTVVFWLVGMVVHFFCCLLVVLPMFVSHYNKSESILWNPFVALAYGGALGYGAFALLAVTLSRGDFVGFEPKLPLIGAAYGVWTAIWSLRTKPKPPPDEN